MSFKKIPNYITIFRIAIVPVIILTFYFDDRVFAHRISALLFLIASISDFLDGFIARKYNIESNFGKMFDPIADKVLIGCILIMLIKFRKIQELPCLLILAREFTVSGLREFLAKLQVSLPVSYLSKLKTAMQMIAITILLLGSKGSGLGFLDILGQILLWISAILTMVSGILYLKETKIHYIKIKSKAPEYKRIGEK